MCAAGLASLLEVGTGFHHELTGRENIFLNGAILGMTRREIVASSTRSWRSPRSTRFLDTPVKRYSSGMYVRLGVRGRGAPRPGHPVVDEVLAVGDAAFQKKCLGKMDSVREPTAARLLFVTHNLSLLEAIC